MLGAPWAAATGPAPSCTPNPLPGVTLYLRGGMNSWAPVEEYAFTYACDAHYLNVDLRGRQELKVADADWSPATNFGEGPPAADGTPGPLVLGGGNAGRSFAGEHTLRLVLAGLPPRQARLEIGPKRFAGPPRHELTDPVALGLRFDSRDPVHKFPFGAQPVGRHLRFTVTAPPGVDSLQLVIERRTLTGNQDKLDYSEVARTAMQLETWARARPTAVGPRDPQAVQRWTATHRFTDKGVYGYWFEARINGQRIVLHNNNEPVPWTRERGTGGRGSVAAMPESPRAIRRFRQTVHDPAFRVPAWAADAVYYQIFPERFRNGDPSNDPQPGRDRYLGGGIEKHARWSGKPYKPGSGDGSDALHNNDFFGGDLAGIVDKLDELKDLGVNTLYLTPIFRAGSNHKYDTADYTAIDPAFGTEADFVRLVREARKRGLRILPDASFNHVGADSPYFDRYASWPELGAFEGGRPAPGSPYASWFRFDTTQADPDRQYRHWGGPDLPEIDKSSADFRAFAYGSPRSVTQHWLSLGAAGWRMDVAPWVPDDFWRDWRSAVKRHRPDALTLAETWFDASKYFVGDMFDSTMNYVFRNAVLDYAAGGRAADLAAVLEHLREAYPPAAHAALMNLIGSHDVARPLHVLGWHDGLAADAGAARTARERLRLAVLLQMSYPGAPMVYYGDEVGMTGGDDPYNRGPYPWADQGGQPDLALRAEFKRLIALRRERAILRHGQLEPMRALDDHLLLSARTRGRQRAWVLLNNSDQPRTATVRDARLPQRPVVWRDALTGERVSSARGQLAVTVPARFGRVLVASVAFGR